MVDVLHAVISEGLDMAARVELDDKLEPAGHEFRAAVNEKYKRATWGRRPEDVAAQKSVIGEMQGR